MVDKAHGSLAEATSKAETFKRALTRLVWKE